MANPAVLVEIDWNKLIDILSKKVLFSIVKWLLDSVIKNNNPPKIVRKKEKYNTTLLSNSSLEKLFFL